MEMNQLRQARMAAGLPKSKLAEIAGVARTTYAHCESGNYYPGAEKRARLAAALGAPENRLWPEGHLGRERTRPDMAIRKDHHTYSSLREQANVAVGDRLIRRLSIDAKSSMRVSCTVVELSARWFRVQWDRSGASECFPYQELLMGKELRRATL